MRVLIAYASRYGQTQKVSERLAAGIRAAGAEVLLFEISHLPRDLRPHACDVVVLAGSLYFGRHQKRLEQFAERHRESLARTVSTLVSVSGAARTPQGMPAAREAVELLIKRTGWTPDRVDLVAGAEPFTRYGFFTRHFMVRYAKKFGRIVDPKRDYEFTDWDAVDRCAAELATLRAESIERERDDRTAHAAGPR